MHGAITTPNYPSNYPGGEDCTWTIRGPDGYHIHVYFDDIKLESAAFSADNITVSYMYFIYIMLNVVNVICNSK